MNKIKLLRIKAGLTQAELAQKVGVVQNAVAKWETGRTYPAVAKLVPLAALLNCTVDELLEE